MTRKTSDFFTGNFQKLKRYLLYSFDSLRECDAEDIIQQTALKFLDGGYMNSEINHLSSYIYAAVLNAARDFFRKNNPLDLKAEPDFADEQTAEDYILNDELGEKIKDALDSLDVKSRHVFVETEIRGRSYEELVRETGEPLGTLLSRKSRARNKLKKLLEDYID